MSPRNPLAKVPPDQLEPEDIESEADEEEALDVLDLVQEVLGDQPLTAEQADGYKLMLAALVEKLSAAGLARELWGAIVMRTECGIPLSGEMHFFVGDRLVKAIEEAVGVEALEAGDRADRACAAPDEEAAP
jgi:hypothetical protein